MVCRRRYVGAEKKALFDGSLKVYPQTTKQKNSKITNPENTKGWSYYKNIR